MGTDTTPRVILQEILATNNGKDPCIMRLLVKEVGSSSEKQAIKYIRVEDGALPNGWRNPWNSLYQTLPLLPSGIWNVADLCKPQEGSQLAYSNLRAIQWYHPVQPWHDTIVDYFDLDKELLLPFMHAKNRRADTLWLVRHVLFGSRLVLMKIAETPNDMETIAQETEVYHTIQGTSIAPAFLGHIREEGRIVGFLVEYLDACTHPEGKDYDACRLALSNLHACGYLHGDIHTGNILVRPDGTAALLIDFEFSQRCDDKIKFEQELEELRQNLVPEQDGILKLEYQD